MPYTMGMCTLGFAVRMVIQQLFPLSAGHCYPCYTQIRNAVSPARNVTVQIWKDSPGRVIFKFVDEENVCPEQELYLGYKTEPSIEEEAKMNILVCVKQGAGYSRDQDRPETNT